MKKRYGKLILNGKEYLGPFECNEDPENEAIILNGFEKKEIPPSFFKMDSERRAEAEYWLYFQLPETKKENLFCNLAAEAFDNVRYDYYISTIEPSGTDSGIEFIEGGDVLIALSKEKWQQIAKRYDPSHNSRLATLYELFIWYCWRCFTKHLSLKSLVECRYSDTQLKKSGSEMVAGFCDGINNTYKVVMHNSKIVYVGRAFNSNCSMVDIKPEGILRYSSGVVVLTD